MNAATERRSENRPAERNMEGERRASDTLRIRERLQQRGRVSLRVRGSSMLPWVRPGDVALVRRNSADSARCGDVVLFARDERLFVHRLVEKRDGLNGTQFLAKGDAQPGPDGLLKGEEILGRVVRIYRRNRRIDLDSPKQVALGLIISQISAHSRLWYALVRAAAHLTRPLRRILLSIRTAGAPAR